MSDIACLALLLDSPLQSWGSESRFQRRTTELHPTKSGVIGIICAAMGLAKGSPEEQHALPKLAALTMTTIAIPAHDILRLEDFHTTGGGYDKKTQPLYIPRKASGGPCDNPTVSRRHYLLEARFGVILEGDKALLEQVAAALRDPAWGVWLGRRSCIPTAPILRGLFPALGDAQRALIGDAPAQCFTTVTDVTHFDEGTDSLNDTPLSFGDPKSSGLDHRRFAPRRIRITPASVEGAESQT